MYTADNITFLHLLGPKSDCFFQGWVDAVKGFPMLLPITLD